MKKSHSKVYAVAVLIAAVGGYLVLTYLHRPQPSFKEAVVFVRSVYPFVAARLQHGSPLPPSVPLSELVDGGYITPDMARRFGRSDVTFPSPPPTQTPLPLERAPEQVLISLRLPDGRKTVMTADGSIHQLPK